jgi:hypothetical protein
MKPVAFIISVFLVLLLWNSPTQAAGAVTSGTTTTTIASLSSAGTLLDGQKVDFVGEVVGDVIDGGSDNKWLTLYDAGASISVFVSDSDAQQVTNLGRYGRQGTKLEIRGVYRLACEEHQGLSDVHALTVKVFDEGGPVPSSLNIRQLQVGLLLVGIGLLLLLLHWRLRERTR